MYTHLPVPEHVVADNETQAQIKRNPLSFARNGGFSNKPPEVPYPQRLEAVMK